MINKVDVRSVIEFNFDLQQHILNAGLIFDDSLLLLIDKYFGYKQSAITVYNSEYRLINIISHKNAVSMRQPYFDYFSEHDAVSRHNSEHAIEYLNSEDKIILSSDFFSKLKTNSHDREIYLNFLRHAGFNYVATIPFDKFRVNFYRSLEEGDFSHKDVETMKMIRKSVKSMMALRDYVKNSKVVTTITNDYFNYKGLGLIILDHKFRVIDTNRVAYRMFDSQTNAFSIAGYIRSNVSKCRQREKKENDAYMRSSLRYKNYEIKVLETGNGLSNEQNESNYLVLLSLADDNYTKQINIEASLRDVYGLSTREIQIVKLLYDGMKYKDIAEINNIALNTVRSHIKNVYKKLEVNNRVQLFMKVEKLTRASGWE